MSLANVCLVIDFDGFFIQKKFHVREMGFASLTTEFKGSYRFKLDHLADRATDKDWRTIRYCTNYIHGLSLKSLPGEKNPFDEEFLKILLKLEYKEAKTAEKYLVAFKGGHVERDVLEELEIPYVNLEDFGCPKFDCLEHFLKPVVKDCGYHKKLRNEGATAHCPRIECFFFAEWVKNEL